MSKTFKGSMLFLLLIMILALILARFIKPLSEGYKNIGQNNIPLLPGDYPVSDDKPILNDWSLIEGNNVSSDSATEIWWHYPLFSLPSFKQITNNLRYFKNPDIGTCTRPEFCGALYHDIKNKSNEIFPLPEAEEGPGARVGYFRSEPNKLYWSIPTNENILY
jgi:hypothetical protein